MQPLVGFVDPNCASFKVGDTVIYSKYAGTEVKYEGVEYIIVAQRDILAIVG